MTDTERSAASVPVADIRAITRSHHGDDVEDRYEWLRAKEDSDVVAHLEAENAYTADRTAHLEPLGQAEPGSAGFVLYLTADSPDPVTVEGGPVSGIEGASFGRDLTPVLRQPINRIIANAETIRTKLAGPIADEYSSYAADIATAAQHLLALIDDLSDLEVVESDQFVTAPDRIELADVARRACGILGVRAQEKGITLVPPVEGESQLAIAEFRRVLQIMLNLVGNAIRYTPEGGRVTVSCRDAGTFRALVVEDTGVGIAESDQKRIFERFYRVGKSRGSGDGGTGIGLSIVKNLAITLGGEVRVSSRPGEGAKFEVLLPKSDPPPASEVSPSDDA